MGEIIKIGEGKFEEVWKKICPHKHLTYDQTNEIIECKDCRSIVSPFKAFIKLLNDWQKSINTLKARYEELNELEKRKEKGLLLATRKVDNAWRQRGMVPNCPHCREAIFPDDCFGDSLVNKETELQKRRFKKARYQK